jgi:hypothetical protein
MTFDEFKGWMLKAQDDFESLRTWMNKQSKDAQRKVWSTWSKTLRDVPNGPALEAIDRMVADTKLQPFGGRWEQLPGIVIGLCAGVSSRPKGNSHCICHGTGIVLVGSKRPAKTIDGSDLRAFDIDGVTHYGPIGVNCLCPLGKWISECERKSKVNAETGPRIRPEYDPKRVTLAKGIDTVFAPALEERDRQMMSQTLMEFDDIQTNVGFLEELTFGG